MTSESSTSPATDAEARYRPGLHWVALFAAVFTLPLLFVGGSVTSFGVGMAVPDWPQTFGVNMFFYNFWNAPFGVRVEHTHRLYGAAVGLATVILTVSFLAFERRKAMKVLGVVSLATVIVQGVLGGTRVTQVSTFLAAVHGCTGQAFFGLMVAISVMTGRRWLEPVAKTPDVAGLRRRAATTLALVYAQIAVGAWFRHFGSTAALWTHLVVAAAVWAHAAILAMKVGRRKNEIPALWPSARAMGLIVTLQVVLGVAALWIMLPLGGNPRPPTLWQAMLRTAHQTNGALLLASTLVLTLRAFRQLGPAPSPALPTLGRPETAPRSLEAVA